MWRKGILVQFWQECKLVQPLWKIVWCYLKKLKQTNKQKTRTELLYIPAVPLLGIYLKKKKKEIKKSGPSEA